VLYLFYLLGYFAAMIFVSIRATVKKQITSAAQTVMLLGAVFVNICVWAIEQFVDIEFEFLSLSYIITELFLIGVYVMIQESEKRIEAARKDALMQLTEENNNSTMPQIDKEVLDAFNRGITELTHTEKLIYDLYIAGKNTKEVLTEMNIKENTLKYHNKNIYGKLGVASRKELKAIAKSITD
jgi:DNA-binding CsgD family transcriptional regulator